jgi:hypothetical protein
MNKAPWEFNLVMYEKLFDMRQGQTYALLQLSTLKELGTFIQ